MFAIPIFSWDDCPPRIDASDINCLHSGALADVGKFILLQTRA